MGETPAKRIALDTNVPLDLADGVPNAIELLDIARRRSFLLCLPPTAVQELAFIAQKFAHPANEKAILALTKLRSDWGITPYDLKGVGHAITENFSIGLIRNGLLPAGERNDGLILAEASLNCVELLVTSDHHLLDIRENLLKTAFGDADLEFVRPIHPKDFVRLHR